MIDLHNLHIQNKVSLIANPLNECRDFECLLKGLDMLDLGKKVEQEDENIMIEKVKSDNKLVDKSKPTLEDCYTMDKEGTLNCKFCSGKYKKEGHFKNHIETKHNVSVDLICTCGQVFDDTTRYCRHKKSCK